MAFEPTQQQQAVIDHDVNFHARVIAGPGTGKSATAVALARRLQVDDPDVRVRFLTFTRAATSELALKLGELGVPTTTVHGFAISVLLANPGAAPFPLPLRMPDKWEERNIVEAGLGKLMGAGVSVTDIRKKFIPEMAANWESLVEGEDPRISAEERQRFRGAFNEHRQIFGYTLVGEIPDLLRRALEEHDNLEGLEHDVLVVDEYQDLNACDLRVFKLLADRGATVIAIGDDDQSIYSFRKAAPEGIRRFPEEFGTEHDYPLTKCHRCPKEITDWAHSVIAGDPNRAERPEIDPRDGGEPGMVALLRFETGEAEAKGIARLAAWLRDDRGVPPSEMLVLTRTDNNGNFTAPIKAEFEAREMQPSDPARIKQMLDEPKNRAFLARLRLALNGSDSLGWATLIRLWSGVGDSFLDYVYDTARSAGNEFGESFLAEAEKKFEAGPRSSAVALENLAPVRESLDAIVVPNRDEVDSWAEWIATQIAADLLPEPEGELLEVIASIEELLEGDVPLDRLSSQIQTLGTDLARANDSGVRFMTMTSSKGLTVGATFVAGVDDDLIPRGGEDMQEERRLLYVAMTRSTEYLFLTYARRRSGAQARAGRQNFGLRNPTRLLDETGIAPIEGEAFLTEIGA